MATKATVEHAVTLHGVALHQQHKSRKVPDVSGFFPRSYGAILVHENSFVGITMPYLRATQTITKALFFAGLLSAVLALAVHLPTGDGARVVAATTGPSFTKHVAAYNKAAYSRDSALLWSAAFYFTFTCCAAYWLVAEAQAMDMDVGSVSYTTIKLAFMFGLLLLQAGIGLLIWSLSAVSSVLATSIHNFPRPLFVIPSVVSVAGLFTFGYLSWSCCPPAKQRQTLL